MVSPSKPVMISMRVIPSENMSAAGPYLYVCTSGARHLFLRGRGEFKKREEVVEEEGRRARRKDEHNEQRKNANHGDPTLLMGVPSFEKRLEDEKATNNGRSIVDMFFRKKERQEGRDGRKGGDDKSIRIPRQPKIRDLTAVNFDKSSILYQRKGIEKKMKRGEERTSISHSTSTFSALRSRCKHSFMCIYASPFVISNAILFE